jgi:hypothetical protein
MAGANAPWPSRTAARLTARFINDLPLANHIT